MLGPTNERWPAHPARDGAGMAVGILSSRRYLNLRQAEVGDLDLLEQLWERAVTLATKFVPDRAAAVVTTVAKRLVPLGRFEAAAELCGPARPPPLMAGGG